MPTHDNLQRDGQQPVYLENERIHVAHYSDLVHNLEVYILMFLNSTSGVVTYVSPAYGGSTSDRQIIESSELLEDGKFESGDSIMADRGKITMRDTILSRNTMCEIIAF